jgi:hypothetical protein
LKLSRKHFYSGFTVLLFLFPGIILGCDLLNNSMADYFLDHTAIVGVTGFKVKTEYAMMSDETILIPPGSAKIGVNLSNSRNFSVRQELLGVPEGKHITARQIGPVEIEVNIEGAEEGDDYPLTLAMQSPDGLRDFPAYSLRIKCVSFETALRDFTVNGAVPPAFDPAKSAFRVDVSHTTVTVTFEGTTVHSGAVIEIYAGTDDSGTVLVKAAHTAEITQDLETGDNYFYVKITAPSSTAWGYVVTVYRPLDTEKMITVFYVTVGSKQYGVGTGVESGSGSISGNKITVTVPYGTDVTGMTAAASHTGTSISPDPAAARSYAAPVSYTVTAADGTTETYTVTVNAAPGDAKAITAFTVTGPVSAAGTVNEALKTVTVTVPYGTSVTAMTAAASHTGASISPDPAAARSYAAPVSYTVTAADGTTETYTVTVSPKPGITISGITVESLSALTFSGVSASPVSASTTIAITISGGVTPDSWHVDINGPVTATHATSSFSAPSIPGFYNINVIATVGGANYSGSFGLTVDN